MREWEKNIRRVVPYVPGEQPKQANVIKLNTNENPYPPSPKVKEMSDQLKKLAVISRSCGIPSGGSYCRL